MPAEHEDVTAFLARCAPSTLGAGGSLGAVGPSFSHSPADLAVVAKDWTAAWDGMPSMLEFGAARGLTAGAWQLDGIAYADADSVWRTTVIGLTQQQLGSYLAMTAPAPTAALRVGTANWQDLADVERVLAALRALGLTGPCSYTVQTYERKNDNCVVGSVPVWTAAAGAVSAIRHGAVTASAANTPRDRTGQKPKPKAAKSMEVASGDATRQAQRESNRLKRAARRRAARQRHQQQKLLKPQQTLQKQQNSKAKPKPKPKAQRQNGKGRGRGQQKKQKQKQKQKQLLPRQQPRQPLARLDSDVMTAFSSLGL